MDSGAESIVRVGYYSSRMSLNKEETGVLRLNGTKASGAHNKSRWKSARRERAREEYEGRNEYEGEKGWKERGVKSEKPCSKQEAGDGACGKSSIRYALGHAALF